MYRIRWSEKEDLVQAKGSRGEQLTFLNNHKADLFKKINHFQNMFRKGHLNDRILMRCCDFTLLEEKFKEYSNK